MAHKLIMNKQCHSVAEKAQQMCKHDCCHHGKCHNPCSQICASKQESSARLWPAYFKAELDSS